VLVDLKAYKIVLMKLRRTKIANCKEIRKCSICWRIGRSNFI